MSLPPFVLTVKECPTRDGTFDGWIAGGWIVSDQVISRSRIPFFDAARVLMADGYDTDTTLEMWHEGCDFWHMRGAIGVAAKLTVKDGSSPPRIGRWTPFIPVRVGQERRSRD